MSKPIDLDATFTVEEFKEMMTDGRLQDAARRGYVSQSDGKTCRWVHWTEAATNSDGRLKNRSYQTDKTFEQMREQLDPIRARTPQQRVESLVYRMMEDVKKHGTVIGLSDEKLREIVGEYWKTGRTEVTTDMLRKVAQHYLDEAEKARLKIDEHRVTRWKPAK